MDSYDYQTLKISDTTSGEIYILTCQEAINQIKKARKFHCNSELFGRQKDASFKSSIGSFYKTFEGNYLYHNIGEKAANLLDLLP